MKDRNRTEKLYAVCILRIAAAKERGGSDCGLSTIPCAQHRRDNSLLANTIVLRSKLRYVGLARRNYHDDGLTQSSA